MSVDNFGKLFRLNVSEVRGIGKKTYLQFQVARISWVLSGRNNQAARGVISQGSEPKEIETNPADWLCWGA